MIVLFGFFFVGISHHERVGRVIGLLLSVQHNTQGSQTNNLHPFI